MKRVAFFKHLLSGAAGGVLGLAGGSRMAENAVADPGAGGGDSYDLRAFKTTGTSWTRALQSALDNGEVVAVSGRETIPIDEPITLRYVGTGILGRGRGGAFGFPYLEWTGGPLDFQRDGPMFRIVPTAHSCFIQGVRIGAPHHHPDVLIHVDVPGGSSTQSPKFADLHLAGYGRRGILIGPDVEIDEAGNVVRGSRSNGMALIPALDDLILSGGERGAVGVLINAQNAETTSFRNLWSDPAPGSEHQHHVVAYGGGISVDVATTTRALSYGFVTYEGFSLRKINSEDRFVLKAAGSTNPGTPCSIHDLKQRDHPQHDGARPRATDDAILLTSGGQPVVLSSLSLQGSISVQGADAVVVEQNVLFEKAGAGFRWNGGVPQHGIRHDARAGRWVVKGEAPRVEVRGTGDQLLASLGPDGLMTAATQPVSGVGGVVGRIPVRDAAGVVIGYLPLHGPAA